MSDTRIDPGHPVVFEDPEGRIRFGVTDGRIGRDYRVLELIYYRGEVEVIDEWKISPSLLIFDPEFSEDPEEDYDLPLDTLRSPLAGSITSAVLALPLIVAGAFCAFYGGLMIGEGDPHGWIGAPLFVGAFYLANCLLRKEVNEDDG